MLDWKGIKIGLKDFIVGLVATFSISGVWYKVVYERQQIASEEAAYRAATDKEIKLLQQASQSQQAQIRALQDAELRRSVADEITKEFTKKLK